MKNTLFIILSIFIFYSSEVIGADSKVLKIIFPDNSRLFYLNEIEKYSDAKSVKEMLNQNDLGEVENHFLKYWSTQDFEEYKKINDNNIPSWLDEDSFAQWRNNLTPDQIIVLGKFNARYHDKNITGFKYVKNYPQKESALDLPSVTWLLYDNNKWRTFTSAEYKDISYVNVFLSYIHEPILSYIQGVNQDIDQKQKPFLDQFIQQENSNTRTFNLVEFLSYLDVTYQGGTHIQKDVVNVFFENRYELFKQVLDNKTKR